MSEDGSAVMAKWGRKQAMREEEDRKAKASMKTVIANAMKDTNTKRNITNELIQARQGRPAEFKEGYGDDGEIITGINMDRPWERD